MNPWWTDQQAGLIGGLGGSAIGMVGAMVGSLSFLIVRGKAKTFMVGTFVTMVVIGAALLAAGATALVLKQPYHVWFPLVLGGVITSCVFGGMLPGILGRYRNAEARRMEAEQLRRS